MSVVAESARALHARLFTIDTHSDTPTACFSRAGWNFGERHDYAGDRTQVDLPRMAGAADAMVFAVYVGQMSRSPEGLRAARELARAHFSRTHAVLAANEAACGLALSVDEALRLKAVGRRAILLSIENSHSLAADAASVAEFHALGVRMIGLTHMLNNDVADSSTDPRGAEWGGLSPLGREVVAECNRLGIVLDASHASDKALWDLLGASRTPVNLSHSGCRAVCDHPRNIGDELLRGLAEKGGVISINALPVAVSFVPDTGRAAAFLDLLMSYRDEMPTQEMLARENEDYRRVGAAFPSPRASLEDYVRHIEHAVEVAGIDHVGIGCDFDGGGGVEGLREVSDFPRLTEVLVARGWREADLAKLWGENVLRVMRAAEAQAERG